MADLDSRYRPVLEPKLEGDEELRGLCVASQQKGLFKGGVVAIGVTDRRLLVQSLDRRGNPEGEKVKLMLMRGEGGFLGKLGGGEAQRQGLEALAEWFRSIDAA